MKAGLFVVRGVIGNENDTCTAGFPCPLGPFTGTDLNLTDHVGFIPSLSNAVNFGSTECGATRFDYHENIAPTQPLQVSIVQILHLVICQRGIFNEFVPNVLLEAIRKCQSSIVSE